MQTATIVFIPIWAVLALISHQNELGSMEWRTLSEGLKSDTWYQSECLSGKLTNNLQAMMDQHLRH